MPTPRETCRARGGAIRWGAINVRHETSPILSRNRRILSKGLGWTLDSAMTVFQFGLSHLLLQRPLRRWPCGRKAPSAPSLDHLDWRAAAGASDQRCLRLGRMRLSLQEPRWAKSARREEPEFCMRPYFSRRLRIAVRKTNLASLKSRLHARRQRTRTAVRHRRAERDQRPRIRTPRFSLSFDVRPRRARARFSENRASLVARPGSLAVNASATAANVLGGSNPPSPRMGRRGALNFAGTRPTSSSNGRDRSNLCNSVMLSRANPVPADIPFRPSAMCVIAPSRKHASTTNALLM